jgi:siroheme synthase-like protein
MPTPARYPVDLVVDGRACLVVGGGAVAARKAAGLVAAGAEVRLVASEVGPDVRALDGVRWDERPYQEGDVAGYWLVITATDDPALNELVARDADAHHVWVNSADDPANCSFILPAIARQGDLTVTVSTGGRSPAYSGWVRDRLAADLGPEYATLLDILGAVRQSIQDAGRSTEGLDWRAALDSGMLELVREGRLAEAKERLQACLSSPSV